MEIKMSNIELTGTGKEILNKNEIQTPFDQISFLEKKTDSNKDRREEAIKKKEELKEAIRIRCSLDRPAKLLKIKEHLTEYYGINNSAILERLQYIEAINLPSQYQESFDFLEDERLSGTMVIIVPDELWVKGDQPSESSAENDIILFKQSYFESSDNIGWMVHELAHCQKYKNTTEAYEDEEFLIKEVSSLEICECVL